MTKVDFHRYTTKKIYYFIMQPFLSEPKAYIWYAVKTINNGNKE